MINVFCGKEAVGTCEHTAVLIFSRDRGGGILYKRICMYSVTICLRILMYIIISVQGSHFVSC